MHQPGVVGIVVRQGIPASHVLPPKGMPRDEADSLAQALWHSARWCHVLVGLGQASESLHAQAAYGVSSQPAFNRAFWDQAAQYVAQHGVAPQLAEGDLNVDPDRMLRAPLSVLAALLVHQPVGAGLELASAARRYPLCLYQGPEGTRPSRIHGLLVDTRLAALLRVAALLPRCASTCT